MRSGTSLSWEATLPQSLQCYYVRMCKGLHKDDYPTNDNPTQLAIMKHPVMQQNGQGVHEQGVSRMSTYRGGKARRQQGHDLRRQNRHRQRIFCGYNRPLAESPIR